MPSPPTRPEPVQPVSITLTPDQLRWLDARRSAGSLSRSAALRILLDAAIAQEAPTHRRPAARAAQTEHGTC